MSGLRGIRSARDEYAALTTFPALTGELYFLTGLFSEHGHTVLNDQALNLSMPELCTIFDQSSPRRMERPKSIDRLRSILVCVSRPPLHLVEQYEARPSRFPFFLKNF